jgi:hypothetical protein
MKVSSPIAVTVVAVLLGVAGLLYPIQQNIAELESEIETLGDSLPQADIEIQIGVMQQRIAELESALEERTLVLCPASSASRHQFETALTSELFNAGLERVSIDRASGVPIHGIPTFVIELVVEGDPGQLYEFLRGLESLPWTNRVIHLAVNPGLGRRTVEMKIAVPLESAP